MLDAAVNSDPMIEFSINLCTAIKKHKCLYDRHAPSPTYSTPEREAAWQSIADECEKSVEHCKWRWKNMLKSFIRALRKGKKSKYYLQEHMEYLSSHLLAGNAAKDEKSSETLDTTSNLAAKDEKSSETLDTTSNLDTSNMDIDQSVETFFENKTENSTIGDEETIVKVEQKNIEVEEKHIVADVGNDDSDSDTTSADESHDLGIVDEQQIHNSEIVTDKQNEVLNIVTEIKKPDTNLVGDFVINELNESGANADDDDENLKSRSRYKRACKRGLDAEILNELSTDKQEEKRPRRIHERRKTLSATSIEDLTNKRRSLPNLLNKKLEPKVNKSRTSKSTKVKLTPPSMRRLHTLTYVDIATEQPVNTSLDTVIPNISNSIENLETTKEDTALTNNIYNQTFANITAYQKPQMFDSSTITDFQTRDSSTQYENESEPSDFDDIFINSLKPQLLLMNGRQKMNFKRKVFQSLMEVFDDGSNFPNTEEYIVLPPGGAPRFDSTTTGELRLMRELVSIVQAAKTTPEIMKATEKTQLNPVVEKTQSNPVVEIPPTPQTTQLTQLPSPILLSPTLDEEDITFTTETFNDSDAALPRSLNEILARRDDDEVLGLPRRVIHKVVKVAGGNGSTIVAHNGDKRRVYRIYPKTAVAVDANRVGSKNLGNIGTFYVNPTKTSTPNTTTDIQKLLTKRPASTSNTVYRPLGKPPHVTTVTYTPAKSNNKIPITLPVTASNRASSSSPDTATPILNAETGVFTFPTTPSASTATSKTPPSVVNKPSTAHMLPPTSTTVYSANPNAALRTPAPRTAENPDGILLKTKRTVIQRPPTSSTVHSANPNAALRTPAPRTAENPDGVLMKTTKTIMQRRYSICGPPPSRGSPVPILPKPVMQRVTFSPNGNSIKPVASQFMMSKPVSLNANANNSPTTNIAKLLVSNTSNVTSTTTSNVKQTSQALKPSVFNPMNYVSRELPTTTTTEIPSASVAPITQQREEIPVLETAGTISADLFGDPLFVKPLIKSEPLD